MNDMSGHDFTNAEAVNRLPETLPPGEKILWQGSPNWWRFALSVFHVRLVAIYFVAVGAWQAVSALSDGATVGAALFAGLFGLIWGVPALAILCFMAWLVQRTTVYTITNRRVFMQIGTALPKMLNIPIEKIEAAALSPVVNGIANIALKLKQETKLAYLLIWPHARPWHLRHPQPLLRAIPDAECAARALEAALSKDVPAAEAITDQVNTSEGEDSAPHDPHRVPRIPLIAAAGVVVFAFVAILFSSQTGIGTMTEDNGAQLSTRLITFHEVENDRVAVRDPETGTQITIIEMSKDGLLRNALRAVRDSRARSGSPQVPEFQIVGWENGRITLTDQIGGRNIPLTSFGPAASDAQTALRALGEVQPTQAQP
ncbi:MAG: photosynthetic complex putative assembly protein PuhB [Pseudomonadota bacterium]